MEIVSKITVTVLLILAGIMLIQMIFKNREDEMLDKSGMLWDDPKNVEYDAEKEAVYKLFRGMSPSMQKAVKEIMEVTQVNKEDKKDA